MLVCVLCEDDAMEVTAELLIPEAERDDPGTIIELICKENRGDEPLLETGLLCNDDATIRLLDCRLDPKDRPAELDVNEVEDPDLNPLLEDEATL